MKYIRRFSCFWMLILQWFYTRINACWQGLWQFRLINGSSNPGKHEICIMQNCMPLTSVLGSQSNYFVLVLLEPPLHLASSCPKMPSKGIQLQHHTTTIKTSKTQRKNALSSKAFWYTLRNVFQRTWPKRAS